MRRLNSTEINIISNLGRKAREERRLLEFTIEDVSKVTGLSQQLIYHFEHGRANNCVVYLKLVTFYNMCGSYHISKNYIPDDIDIKEEFMRWLDHALF